MRSYWKGKNLPLILEAAAEATRRGFRNPTIVDLAPGLVTQVLSPWFPPYHCWRTSFLAWIDQLLRKTGKFDTYCYEVQEIFYAFKGLNPKSLYVLYADPAVKNSVREDERIIMDPADITSDHLSSLGDVVFCYHPISKTPNPQSTLSNILDCVKVGGLLSISTETDWRLNPRVNPLFIPLSKNLYLKEF